MSSKKRWERVGGVIDSKNQEFDKKCELWLQITGQSFRELPTLKLQKVTAIKSWLGDLNKKEQSFQHIGNEQLKGSRAREQDQGARTGRYPDEVADGHWCKSRIRGEVKRDPVRCEGNALAV